MPDRIFREALISEISVKQLKQNNPSYSGVIDKIAETVPNKYVQFLFSYFQRSWDADALVRDHEFFSEKLAHWAGYLKTFDKALSSGLIDKMIANREHGIPLPWAGDLGTEVKPEWKDINHWKDKPNVFLKFIKKLSEILSARDLEKRGKKDIDVLHDDQNFLMLVPKTREASCVYGRGTQWCISATESENYFDSYHRDGVRIFMIFDKGKVKGDPNYKIAVAVYTRGFPGKQEAFNAEDDQINWKKVIPEQYVSLFNKKIEEYIGPEIEGERKKLFSELKPYLLFSSDRWQAYSLLLTSHVTPRTLSMFGVPETVIDTAEEYFRFSHKKGEEDLALFCCDPNDLSSGAILLPELRIDNVTDESTWKYKVNMNGNYQSLEGISAIFGAEIAKRLLNTMRKRIGNALFKFHEIPGDDVMMPVSFYFWDGKQMYWVSFSGTSGGGNLTQISSILEVETDTGKLIQGHVPREWRGETIYALGASIDIPSAALPALAEELMATKKYFLPPLSYFHSKALFSGPDIYGQVLSYDFRQEDSKIQLLRYNGDGEPVSTLRNCPFIDKDQLRFLKREELPDDVQKKLADRDEKAGRLNDLLEVRDRLSLRAILPRRKSCI